MLERLRDPFPEFVSKVEAGEDTDPEHVLPPLSEQGIVDLESKLGIPLPDSYKTFLTSARGLWLCGGSVQFGEQHPFFHDFPPLEKLSPQQRRAVDSRGGAWPPPSHGMLCFAEYFLEADGDQVLFDVSDGLVDGEYPVVYYSHRSDPPEVRRVAGTFAGWLNERCVDDILD